MRTFFKISVIAVVIGMMTSCYSVRPAAITPSNKQAVTSEKQVAPATVTLTNNQWYYASHWNGDEDIQSPIAIVETSTPYQYMVLVNGKSSVQKSVTPKKYGFEKWNYMSPFLVDGAVALFLEDVDGALWLLTSKGKEEIEHGPSFVDFFWVYLEGKPGFGENYLAGWQRFTANAKYSSHIHQYGELIKDEYDTRAQYMVNGTYMAGRMSGMGAQAKAKTAATKRTYSVAGGAQVTQSYKITHHMKGDSIIKADTVMIENSARQLTDAELRSIANALGSDTTALKTQTTSSERSSSAAMYIEEAQKREQQRKIKSGEMIIRFEAE